MEEIIKTAQEPDTWNANPSESNFAVGQPPAGHPKVKENPERSPGQRDPQRRKVERRVSYE